MRKIILNLVISLDGYISDNNGGFDWIVGHGDNSGDTGEAFDFPKFLEGVDTLVMGSVCYEDVILSGLDSFDDKKIIVATTRQLEKRDNVEFISGDISSKILDLKNKKGKNIWLFGGAGLTDTFIKNDVVDEYIIGLIPTILGNGRRLFRGDYPKINLRLKETSSSDGVVVMTYVRRS